MLNLRTIHISNKSPPEYEFYVSSVTEGGKWSEHAVGKVTLVTSSKSENPIPIVTTGLKAYDVKAWYAGLSTAGVTFGPSFQTLSDINTSPDTLQALAKISLSTTKQIMPEQSRYIIHPTTLDGCLQLSVVAALARSTSAPKAFLPVSIDELTIWEPASTMYDKKIRILAKGEASGLRSIQGSAEVFDNDGNLIIQGNLTFLSIEGSLQRQKPASPRMPYTRLIWQPDIDRLGVGRNQEFHWSDRVATALSGFEQPPLHDYMELIVHKGKPVDILHIGHQSVPVLANILHGNTSNPLYKSYTVATPDISSMEIIQQAVSDFQNMEICIFDFQLLDTQKYDFVMLLDVCKHHSYCTCDTNLA